MKVIEMLSKTSIGDEVFVVQPMIVRWESMRFENTNIVYARYVVSERTNGGLWGTNAENWLVAVDMPEGTKKYPQHILMDDPVFQCFKTPEEAEIWKVIELQGLEKKVDDHIVALREKTQKKITKLKATENLEKYFTKYPETFLKVI